MTQTHNDGIDLEMHKEMKIQNLGRNNLAMYLCAVRDSPVILVYINTEDSTESRERNPVSDLMRHDDLNKLIRRGFFFFFD